MMIRRLCAGAAIAAGIAVFALPQAAYANTGEVHTAQDCDTWSASVSLDHNTTADKTVDVVTTIPGTTGFTGHHYDTSFGTIWSETGSAPSAGSVTLNIFDGDTLEFTASASLPPSENCNTTTTSTSTTSTSTTSTTSTTSSTSTTAPTTTTTVPPVTTVPPTPPEMPNTGSSSTTPLIGGGLLVAGLAALGLTRRPARRM